MVEQEDGSAQVLEELVSLRFATQEIKTSIEERKAFIVGGDRGYLCSKLPSPDNGGRTVLGDVKGAASSSRSGRRSPRSAWTGSATPSPR